MLNKKHPIFSVALAHRGLHDDQTDENSIPAFEKAIEKGYGIELDVHITKDNKIIVMHDKSTLRTTGVDLLISDVTLKDLEALSLNLTHSKIPLLTDVLDLINGRVPLLIELKAENEVPLNLVPEVLKIVTSYPYQESVALQSFNPYVVKDLRKANTGMPVGQLLSDNLAGQSKFVHFMYRSLLILKISKPDFFNYEIKFIHKRKIQRKRRSLPLLTWTIDNPDKLAKASTLADNIIFEKIRL